MQKSSLAILICLLALSTAAIASTDDARARQQQKLDDACKQAREVKIAPLREAVIKDCIDTGKTEEDCRKFNQDYGEKMGNRAALFMDLPECVKAFKHNQSNRSTR
ncbi:MAG: hypothetical protein IMF09_10605 [Proteobacteria bacterium]|nr:hypothetical protein [Pseudomonadota bacterium]